jgi:hypothetical protein
MEKRIKKMGKIKIKIKIKKEMKMKKRKNKAEKKKRKRMIMKKMMLCWKREYQNLKGLKVFYVI